MSLFPNEQILDGLSDGITVQDREFSIVYQNRVMRTTFGCHLGEKCYAIYEKRDKICEGCGVEKTFLTGQAGMVLRTAFEASGETSYWENACIPLFNDDGTVVAGVEVCRNVTSRVSLEEGFKDRNLLLGQINNQLERKTVELQSALSQREAMEQSLKQEMQRRAQLEMDLRQSQKLEAVGQLAAGIAHEINTPAQYVSDNIQFLAESFKNTQTMIDKYRQVVVALSAVPGHEKLAEEIRASEKLIDLEYIRENAPDAFAQVMEGVSRIAAIVRAMKDFAHPDLREKVPADLNQALLSTLTIAISEYKYVAEIETSLGELPLVPCHVGDLNQAFLNLIVNAAHAIGDVVKTTGGKGLIRVRTSSGGGMARVEIEDTGGGIPEEIRDRVFEPFFTTKEVGRGSGQGLAIARSIVVDKHGGSLTFTSEIGKGTTFIMLLPLDGSMPAEAQNLS